MATYITNDELTTALKALFNKYGLTLPAKYPDIVANANQDAHDQIQEILARKGYTKAQVDTWIQRKEFNRSIGLYWCCVNAAGLDKVDEGTVATFTRLDRRAELADPSFVLLDSDYKYIDPAGLAPPVTNNVVSYGDMANDSAKRPDTFRDPSTGKWKSW